VRGAAAGKHRRHRHRRDPGEPAEATIAARADTKPKQSISKHDVERITRRASAAGCNPDTLMLLTRARRLNARPSPLCRTCTRTDPDCMMRYRHK